MYLNIANIIFAISAFWQVRRTISMCLRPCPKEHITALQVSIAKISCERLLLERLRNGNEDMTKTRD